MFNFNLTTIKKILFKKFYLFIIKQKFIMLLFYLSIKVGLKFF